MRFSTGSQTVRTAWLLKQPQSKETHRGLNTNILVMWLFHYYFSIMFNWSRLYWLYFAFVFLFRAEADPPLYLYAAILFPLLFAVLAAILLICFRRSVEHFPHLLLPLSCLMCGHFVLQEEGRIISKNTPTEGPPQQYSWQQLQGKFFRNLIFLDLHELMWDIIH